MTIHEEITSHNFTLHSTTNCRTCIEYIYQKGINGSAEVVRLEVYKWGGAMITEWLYGNSRYENLPLDLTRTFEGYMSFIHIEELIK